MYKFAIATFAIILLVSRLAHASSLPTNPPITGASELSNYCLYDSTIYSIGSTMCVKKQGLVCVPAPKANAGPDVGGRSYWSASQVELWAPPTSAQCP